MQIGQIVLFKQPPNVLTIHSPSLVDSLLESREINRPNKSVAIDKERWSATNAIRNPIVAIVLDFSLGLRVVQALIEALKV